MPTVSGRLPLLLVLAMSLVGCGGASQATDDPGESANPAETDGDTAWEPEWVEGVLQPLPDGFPSDPLTLIQVDPPGSPDGIYARTMQEILNDIAPVRANVLDRPSESFGTWEALIAAEEQPGGADGHAMVLLTVPGTATDPLAEPIEEELGLTLDDLNIVITTEEIPYVLYQRSDAPWGQSYQEMIEYARENPGEVRYISRGEGTGVDVVMEWIFDQEGIEVEKVIGGNHEEVGIAVAAGEGDISLGFAEVAFTHWQNERVDALLMTGDQPIEPWMDVPTMADLFDNPEVQFGRVVGWAAPASTPDLHREWLFELFSAAFEDERYQERGESQPGRALTIRDHESAMELARSIAEEAEPIFRRLGLHVDDR